MIEEMIKHGHQSVVKEFAAGQAQIQRCRFTLRPAHAKFIYRSQGDTLDVAVVDITSRKINHTYYDAISRLRSLDHHHLYIINLQEDKIAMFKQKWKDCGIHPPSDCPKVIDVRSDVNVSAASCVCCCKTRFKENDTTWSTSLPPFIQYRQDYRPNTGRQRPLYGLVVYTMPGFSYNPFNESMFRIEVTVFSGYQKPDVIVVFLYKPPNISVTFLMELL